MAYTIYIDPGHGANDPGAIGNGYKEKDLTLKFSLMVRDKLLANGGFNVKMTRTTDVNIPLDDRGKMMKGADYGVSFHLNAGGGCGYELIVPNNEAYCTIERLLDEKFLRLGKSTRNTRCYSRDYHTGKTYPRTFNGNKFGQIYNKTDYYSINRQAWSVGVSADIVELAFIDTKEDVANFVNKMDQYANAFVESVCEAFEVPYKKPVAVTTVTTPTTQSSASISKTATVDDLILGESIKSADALKAALQKKNPSLDSKFNNIAEEYIRIGKIYGVRGDIAFAQAMHETGWLKFGGDVKVSQNNFAGIGAVGGGAKGASFTTVVDGVTAQIQHLYAYACKNALPSGEKNIDPRFHLVSRGTATLWKNLNGKWAVPGTTYAQSIIKLFNEIDPNGKPSVSVTPITPQYPKWVAFGANWYWYLDKDTYAKDTLIHDNGKLYVVDENGVMLKNKIINNSGEIK